jgi:hypothetical protein
MMLSDLQRRQADERLKFLVLPQESRSLTNNISIGQVPYGFFQTFNHSV